jgi:hypothetical protein
VSSLSDIPAWYWLLGIVCAVYQGVRGARFQWIFAAEQNREAQQKNSPRLGVAHIWSRREIIVLRCAADAVLYSGASIAGFVALYWAYEVSQWDPHGLGAVLIFLLLFGVLGVTGQLPHLFQQGKLPK